MQAKYEIIIYWSADDNAYLAEVPELPGCMADGVKWTPPSRQSPPENKKSR